MCVFLLVYLNLMVARVCLAGLLQVLVSSVRLADASVECVRLAGLIRAVSSMRPTDLMGVLVFSACVSPASLNCWC